MIPLCMWYHQSSRLSGRVRVNLMSSDKGGGGGVGIGSLISTEEVEAADGADPMILSHAAF
jgi:hypothetical protein